MKSIDHRDFTLSPEDNERLASLCGPFDGHLRQIELKLGVEIANRGFVFRISAAQRSHRGGKLVEALYAEAGETTFDNHAIHLRLAQANVEQIAERSRSAGRGDQGQAWRYAAAAPARAATCTRSPRMTSTSASARREPARPSWPWPARSSTERVAGAAPDPGAPGGGSRRELGFLPGDLSQKVDPYLRPLYDALYEMMGVEKVVKLLEKNVIEIAPLAYMRGRTLNDAFVILDEAQNTTIEQMKMFLTRLGYGSTAVVTGDLTQTDLPKHVKSGLRDAIDVLREVEGVSFTFFESRDVVRHPLVARIVSAYDRRDLHQIQPGATP